MQLGACASDASMVHLTVALTALFCVYIGTAGAEKCASDSRVPEISPLRDALFCNYDPSKRPQSQLSNKTEVRLWMHIMDMKFEEHIDQLEIQAFQIWSWRDERLKWNRSDFGESGLKLRVSSAEIWLPFGSINASISRLGDVEKSFFERRTVYNEGTVGYEYATKYTAHCSPDFIRWPFDSQNCTFKVDYWNLRGNEVNLKLRIPAYGYEIGDRAWKIVDTSSALFTPTYQEAPNVTWYTMHYSIILERHSGGRVATVVVPALVLASLTLCTFWIEPNAPERLLLTSLDILCHCLYLQHLDKTLPSNADKPPFILTIYRDSLLMAGISLVITFVVRRMTVAKSEPPSWISNLLKGILSSQIGQIFLLTGLDLKNTDADDADDAEVKDSSKASQRWKLFAVFLDRTSFLLYCLTFVILLSAYLWSADPAHLGHG